MIKIDIQKYDTETFIYDENRFPLEKQKPNDNHIYYVDIYKGGELKSDFNLRGVRNLSFK